MPAEPTYTEKCIRNKILNKVNPVIKHGRASHNMGIIMLNGKKVAKVKIPNSHQKEWKSKQLKKMAENMKIPLSFLCGLIDCNKTGSDYYTKLEQNIEDA